MASSNRQISVTDRALEKARRPTWLLTSGIARHRPGTMAADLVDRSGEICVVNESDNCGSAGVVLAAFAKLGVTVWRPVAHIGYFRDEFVERRRWLTDQAYADLVHSASSFQVRPPVRLAWHLATNEPECWALAAWGVHNPVCPSDDPSGSEWSRSPAAMPRTVPYML